jgi:alginate O-acetyltransferase complex protein AlgJ
MSSNREDSLRPEDSSRAAPDGGVVERKELRRFLLGLLVFAAPFIAAVLIDAFVLPIDFFCFRVWEAVIPGQYPLLLPGPFYPDMHIVKTEEGDLGYHTPRAVKKHVEWWTDRHGYRKRETGARRHAIVLIGDSDIAGSGLTQDSILSEVLERQLGISVYPLAPADVNAFFRDERFRSQRPDAVIVSSIERTIPMLAPIQPLSPLSGIRASITRFLRYNPISQRVMVIASRLLKATMYHYLKARVDEWSRPPVSRTPGTMLFLQGDAANADVPPGPFERTVEKIVDYRDQFAANGMHLVFLPVPNKENIYYQMLPAGQPAMFLRKLVSALEAKGVDVIDTQSAFDAAREQGVILYQLDDTHWNTTAVQITADLICRRLAAQHYPPALEHGWLPE